MRATKTELDTRTTAHIVGVLPNAYDHTSLWSDLSMGALAGLFWLFGLIVLGVKLDSFSMARRCLTRSVRAFRLAILAFERRTLVLRRGRTRGVA